MWKPIWEKVKEAPTKKPKQYRISLSTNNDELFQVLYFKRKESGLALSKKVPITLDEYYARKDAKSFNEEIQRIEIKYKEERKNKQYQYLQSYIYHIRDEEGLPEYLYEGKKKRGTKSKYSGINLVDLMKKHNIKHWNNVIADYSRKPHPMVNGYPNFRYSKFEEFKGTVFAEYQAQGDVFYIDKYLTSKKDLWDDLIKYCESKNFINYKNIEDIHLTLILLLFNEVITNQISLRIECDELLALLMRSALMNRIDSTLFSTVSKRIANNLVDSGSIKTESDFDCEEFSKIILGELESYVCHNLVNKNIDIIRNGEVNSILGENIDEFEKNVLEILENASLINLTFDLKKNANSYEVNFLVYELRKRYRNILMDTYEIKNKTVDDYCMYRLSYETISENTGDNPYKFSDLDLAYPINIIHIVDGSERLIKRYLQIYPFMRNTELFSNIVTLLNFRDEEQDDYDPEIIEAKDLISQDEILSDNLLYGSLLFELPLVYVPTETIREKYSDICAARQKVYPEVKNIRKGRKALIFDSIKYAAQNYSEPLFHVPWQEALEELHTIYYDFDNFQHRNNRKKKYRL